MADEEVIPVQPTNTYPGLHQAIGVVGEDVQVTADIPEPAAPVAAPAPAEPVVAAAQPAEAPEAPAAPVTKSKIDFSTLSDDEKNEYLAELTGGKIKTLAELTPQAQKTPEQIEADATKRKNDALAWALENGKVKKEDYDSAIGEKGKSDREIALNIFVKSAMEDDKDLSKEEAAEMFKDAYHEQDETSKLYKVGQKEIKKLADAYRAEKLSAIDNIEPEYDEFVQTQNQFKAYKAQVKEVVAELPKELTLEIPFEGEKGSKETFTYKFPVEDKIVAKILADYSNEREFATRNIVNDGKFDKKAILAEMNYHLKARLFDLALPEMLKNAHLDAKKSTLAALKNVPNQPIELNNGRQNTNPQRVEVKERPGLHQAIGNQRN